MTEKRRAEDEMRRRNRELNALNAMAVVAAQSFDLDEILNLTLRQVVTLFGAESGTVYLSDTDIDDLSPPRGVGPAQPRQDARCRSFFHRRIWRSGHALPHGSDHGGIHAAPSAEGC